VRHLDAGDLVDLADGTRPESSAAHLASCERCRGQLADLRAMLSAAVEADVPEPSPLYWDQLSTRVEKAVERERATGAPLKTSRGLLLRHGLWTRLPIAPLAAAALVAIAVPTILKTLAPTPPAALPSDAVEAPPPVVDQNAGAEAADVWRDDVWLTFVADLAAGVDADAVRDEGLDAMNADDAVMQLNDGELRELERLLRAQIRNQGD
jgi:hypothetical protein